jgi:hypothetical protein
MDLLEHARLEWQQAQADLQTALAALEKCVAGLAGPAEVTTANEAVSRRRAVSDALLQRYITQLGKS